MPVFALSVICESEPKEKRKLGTVTRIKGLIYFTALRIADTNYYAVFMLVLKDILYVLSLYLHDKSGIILIKFVTRDLKQVTN
jgi:hypothetical protein